jgi:geranylgeranyl reductase family protein
VSDRCEVLVVGAGPAGSTAATLFARAGFDVILLERARFPRPKACAEYLSPGVREMLTRLQLDSALASAHPLLVPGMDIVSARGATLRLRYRRDGEHLLACTLSRRVLDAALAAHAAGSGADLREGWTALEPLLEDQVVRGVRARTTLGERTIRASLTVIADGARSRLAGALGLALLPRWPVRLGLVAHYRGPAALDAGFGRMQVERDGYCGVAPLPAGVLNVAAVVRADAIRTAGIPAARFLDRWIEASPGLRKTLDGCERLTPVRGLVPIGARSRRAWAPGALLVGDAASFFDPFTGEGIYRALRGAELAFDVGRTALESSDLSAAALAPYDRLRTLAFRRKAAVTALVQLFVQSPRLLDYALPRLVARERAAGTLSLVLGDVADARDFLRPTMLWSALHP